MALVAMAGPLLSAPGSRALTRASHLTHQTGGSTRKHPGFRRGTASWYRDDHLATACGFHATFGVANRTLPCGAHVIFLHAGRRVTAVVDDRGPYVKGLSWDLDEHTAGALHVSGIASVWARVMKR
jgi:rare lipoprotein A (peptidoglycan hydrolase)